MIRGVLQFLTLTKSRKKASSWPTRSLKSTFKPSSRLVDASHRSHQTSKKELQKYITGIVTKQGQKLIRINGMPDHLHVLIGLKPAMALANLVRDIKSDSSEWVNRKKLARGKFAWQEGYGAFSYGHSQLDTIVRYIMNQEKHHSRRSFRDEYLTLLRKFEIEFKEEYVFEFYD